MDNIINLEQYKLIKKVREMAETVSNDTDLHLLSYYTSICDEFTSVMFQIENFKIREPEDFDIFWFAIVKVDIPIFYHYLIFLTICF